MTVFFGRRTKAEPIATLPDEIVFKFSVIIAGFLIIGPLAAK